MRQPSADICKVGAAHVLLTCQPSWGYMPMHGHAVRSCHTCRPQTPQTRDVKWAARQLVLSYRNACKSCCPDAGVKRCTTMGRTVACHNSQPQLQSPLTSTCTRPQ